MTRIRWRVHATSSEQLRDISGIEQIALIAELAVNFDRAVVLHYKLLRVFLTQADQGIGRALPRAAATENQRLDIEHTHRVFMKETVKHGFVVQTEQFF